MVCRESTVFPSSHLIRPEEESAAVLLPLLARRRGVEVVDVIVKEARYYDDG